MLRGRILDSWQHPAHAGPCDPEPAEDWARDVKALLVNPQLRGATVIATRRKVAASHTHAASARQLLRVLDAAKEPHKAGASPGSAPVASHGELP